MSGHGWVAAKVGDRFGHLTVIEIVHGLDLPASTRNGVTRGRVRLACDCGSRLTLYRDQLRIRKTCGCHDDRAARDEKIVNRRKVAYTRGFHRPGVEASGLQPEPGWPVCYLVVTNKARTVHDNFEEAAEEFCRRRAAP